MKKWAEHQYQQQEAKYEQQRNENETHKPPTLLGAAIRGILSVAGAMLLIALAIWVTTGVTK